MNSLAHGSYSTSSGAFSMLRVIASLSTGAPNRMVFLRVQDERRIAWQIEREAPTLDGSMIVISRRQYDAIVAAFGGVTR
jgi:hypothetical protein